MKGSYHNVEESPKVLGTRPVITPSRLPLPLAAFASLSLRRSGQALGAAGKGRNNPLLGQEGGERLNEATLLSLCLCGAETHFGKQVPVEECVPPELKRLRV